MICDSGVSAEERTEPSQSMVRHSSPDTIEPASALQPSSREKDTHLLGVRYEQIIMLMLASITSQLELQSRKAKERAVRGGKTHKRRP
ncbi:MAG: hypothetical protein CFE49_19885 [Pseudomonas sp. PGPPP3]|nr:MAG: hypothetical protein CFE49_19885 [Pseudomonas sp. PGPPP3]